MATETDSKGIIEKRLYSEPSFLWPVFTTLYFNVSSVHSSDRNVKPAFTCSGNVADLFPTYPLTT